MICVVKNREGKILLASDNTWKAKQHSAFLSGKQQILTGQLGFVMTYDARCEEAWIQQNFDDSSWAYAVPWIPGNEPAAVKLSPRPIPAPLLGERMMTEYVKCGWVCRQTEDVSYARTVWEKDQYEFNEPAMVYEQLDMQTVQFRLIPDHANGIVLIGDLKEEAVGFWEFEIKAPAGTLIDLSHGEHLADGIVRAWVGGRNFTDRYYCKEGWNRFQFPFRRIGARYLQVNIFPPENQKQFNIQIGYLGIRRYNAPLPPQSSFRTDDPQSEQLRNVAIRTLNLCMHDHYEDCPWREQSLYSYDSRNQMLYGYYVWGNYDFVRASLVLLGKGIGKDGLLNICAPNAPGSLRIIMYSYVWICQIKEYYLYSGDVSLFLEFAEQIRFMVEKLFTRRDEKTGLFLEPYGRNLWNFIEWVPGLEGEFNLPEEKAKYISAPFNAYVLEALMAYADLLQITGYDPEMEKMLRRESAELKKLIHQYYFDSRQNLYHSFLNPDGTQSEWQHLHTQYLMLSLDVVPQDLKDKVYQACRQQNTPFTFSPLLYMMWAMAEISPESRRYAREYIDAQYSAMLQQGATTFWEVDEGEKAFENAGSLCHAWSSIHAWYYGRMTLGVNPLEPGFRRFELRIDPGDFCEAEGDIPTPDGLIHVAWRRQNNGSLILKIRYPQHLKAVFRAYEEAPYEKITEEKY